MTAVFKSCWSNRMCSFQLGVRFPHFHSCIQYALVLWKECVLLDLLNPEIIVSVSWVGFFKQFQTAGGEKQNLDATPSKRLGFRFSATTADQKSYRFSVTPCLNQKRPNTELRLPHFPPLVDPGAVANQNSADDEYPPLRVAKIPVGSALRAALFPSQILLQGLLNPGSTASGRQTCCETCE